MVFLNSEDVGITLERVTQRTTAAITQYRDEWGNDPTEPTWYSTAGYAWMNNGRLYRVSADR